MNLKLFCPWADWDILGNTEMAQQKLKYANFEGGVFISFMSKRKLKKNYFRTTKLLKIKQRNFKFHFSNFFDVEID